ncbi:hypothetical protein JHK82_012590 [Glycine max]|nr:hypothetical protein JHK86_012605 [Glycine max]KAG5154621.1 hypothetical protein JHK82_012590 [Glycine max]
MLASFHSVTNNELAKIVEEDGTIEKAKSPISLHILCPRSFHRLPFQLGASLNYGLPQPPPPPPPLHQAHLPFAHQLFVQTPPSHRNVVVWNTIISFHAHNNNLSACINITIFSLIKEIHDYALIIVINSPSGIGRDTLIAHHYYGHSSLSLFQNVNIACLPCFLFL